MELLKFIILATFSVITYGRGLELSDSGDLFETANLNGDNDDDLATAQSQYLNRWSVPNYGPYYSPVLNERNYGNFKTNIQSQLQNQQQSAGDVRKYYGIHNGIGGFSTVEGIGATSRSQSQSQSQTQIEQSGTLGDNLPNLDSSQIQAQLQRYGGSSDQIQGQLQGYGSSQQLQSQLQGYNGGSADQLQAQYQGYGGAVEQLQGLPSQLQAVDGGLEQPQGYNGGISDIGGSSQQLQSQLQRYGYGGNAEQLQAQLQGYGDGSINQVQVQLQGNGDNSQIQGQLDDYRNSQLQAQLQGYSSGNQAQSQAQLQGYNGGNLEQLQGQYQGYNGDSLEQLQVQDQGYNGGSLEQLQGQYQGSNLGPLQGRYQGYRGGISGISGTSRQLQGNSQGASLLKAHPQISTISSLGRGRTIRLLDGYSFIPTTKGLPVSLGWNINGKSALDYGSYDLGVSRDLKRRRYNIYPKIIPISKPSTVGYSSVNPVLGNNYRYSNVISSGLRGLSNPLLLEKDYKRYNVIRPSLRPYLSYRSIHPLTYSSRVQATPVGVYTGYKQYIKPSLTRLYGDSGITSVGTEYQTPIIEKYDDLDAYNLNRDYKHYKIVRPGIIRILKSSGTGGYSDFSLGDGYGGYTLYQPWSKSLQGQIQSSGTLYPSSNIPVLRSSGYGEPKSLQSQYQGASGVLPSNNYQGQYQASSLLSPSVQAQAQPSGWATSPNSLQQTQAQVQSSGGWDTAPNSYQAQMQASGISKREAPTEKALFPTKKNEDVVNVAEN